MIKEEYVSLDTAKLLKDAGYPQTAEYINVPVKYLANPIRCTQAQAMRWLREKKIFISIQTGIWETINKEPVPTYRAVLTDIPEYAKFLKEITKGNFGIRSEDRTDDFPTYEAAAEAGIQAACKYLIQKQ